MQNQFEKLIKWKNFAAQLNEVRRTFSGGNIKLSRINIQNKYFLTEKFTERNLNDVH